MKEKENRLFNILSDTDDDLLNEALGKDFSRKGGKGAPKWAATAATVFILLLALLFFPRSTIVTEPETPAPVSTEPSPETARQVKEESFVTLDVNPSLQFRLENGTVVACSAFNEEGEAIFEELDLEGKPLNEVVDTVVHKLVKEGYLQWNEETIAVLLFSARGEEDCIDLLRICIDSASIALRQDEIPAFIVTQTVTEEKVVALAEEYGISPGKMQYILNLQKEEENGFLEEAAGRSLVELFAMDPSKNVVKSSYEVGDRDQYGELILWVPEYEDTTGYRPWDDLPEEQQNELKELYSPEDLAIMFSPPVWSTMPNVIGLTQQEATELMHSRGLAVIFIYYDDKEAVANGFTDGQVFYQDFFAGRRIRSDCAVLLNVQMTGAYDPWDEFCGYHYIKYWEPLPEGLNRGNPPGWD